MKKVASVEETEAHNTMQINWKAIQAFRVAWRWWMIGDQGFQWGGFRKRRDSSYSCYTNVLFFFFSSSSSFCIICQIYIFHFHPLNYIFITSLYPRLLWTKLDEMWFFFFRKCEFELTLTHFFKYYCYH